MPRLRLAELQAHPRVCGENDLQDIQSVTSKGSSPRVRGKLCVFGHVGLWVGLIPACAGKTVYKWQ